MRTVGPVSIVAEAGRIRMLLADEESDDFVASALLTLIEARDFALSLQRTIHEAEQQRADQAGERGPVAAGTEFR